MRYHISPDSSTSSAKVTSHHGCGGSQPAYDTWCQDRGYSLCSLNNRNLFHTVLKAGSLKSCCQHSQGLMKVFFLAWGDGHLLNVSSLREKERVRMPSDVSYKSTKPSYSPIVRWNKIYTLWQGNKNLNIKEFPLPFFFFFHLFMLVGG